MRIDILTLFPDLFIPFREWSMIKKAREIKALDLKIQNLRKWAIDKRGTVDDRPYGGGPGMILRPEPIFNALETLKKRQTKSQKTILLSPKGKTFHQKTARELVKIKHLILICGHYEGVDERVRKHMIDEEISVGNYVLSGGELPAMIIADTVSRLLAGVLKKEGAAEEESFSPGLEKMITDCRLPVADYQLLTEYPQYTRPLTFKTWKVPKVLTSGDHQKINQWRGKRIKSSFALSKKINTGKGVKK